MKKNVISILLLVLFNAFVIKGQEGVEVEVIGRGKDIPSAKTDAYRAAVEAGAGVIIREDVKSNFEQLVRNELYKKSEGYIVAGSSKWYKEPLQTDVNNWEVYLRCRVSQQAVEADVDYLSEMIGGIQFIVLYDYTKISSKAIEKRYQYASNKINEFLEIKGIPNYNPKIHQKPILDSLKNISSYSAMGL